MLNHFELCLAPRAVPFFFRQSYRFPFGHFRIHIFTWTLIASYLVLTRLVRSCFFKSLLLLSEDNICAYCSSEYLLLANLMLFNRVTVNHHSPDQYDLMWIYSVVFPKKYEHTLFSCKRMDFILRYRTNVLNILSKLKIFVHERIDSRWITLNIAIFSPFW